MSSQADDDDVHERSSGVANPMYSDASSHAAAATRRSVASVSVTVSGASPLVNPLHARNHVRARTSPQAHVRREVSRQPRREARAVRRRMYAETGETAASSDDEDKSPEAGEDAASVDGGHASSASSERSSQDEDRGSTNDTDDQDDADHEEGHEHEEEDLAESVLAVNMVLARQAGAERLPPPGVTMLTVAALAAGGEDAICAYLAQFDEDDESDAMSYGYADAMRDAAAARAAISRRTTHVSGGGSRASVSSAARSLHGRGGSAIATEAVHTTIHNPLGFPRRS